MDQSQIADQPETTGLFREWRAITDGYDARYRWIYGVTLGVYAAVVVAAGVVAGAGVALTPVAGITTSLIAAFGLAAVDRWLIAPRLERWQRHRNVRLLKADVLFR